MFWFSSGCVKPRLVKKKVIVTGYFQNKSRTGNSNEFERYSSVFCSGKNVSSFETALVVFYLFCHLGIFHEIVVQWK